MLLHEIRANYQPTRACPDSWNATVLRSATLIACERFSVPPTSRSTAYSRSLALTIFSFVRAACRAASLHTFAMSAPEKPGVKMARLNNNILKYFFMVLTRTNFIYTYIGY